MVFRKNLIGSEKKSRGIWFLWMSSPVMTDDIWYERGDIVNEDCFFSLSGNDCFKKALFFFFGLVCRGRGWDFIFFLWEGGRDTLF